MIYSYINRTPSLISTNHIVFIWRGSQQNRTFARIFFFPWQSLFRTPAVKTNFTDNDLFEYFYTLQSGNCLLCIIWAGDLIY